MGFDTGHFVKSAAKNKGKLAVGAYRGLSAAAIVWLYATFPTIKDLDRLRDSQSKQWQALADARKELAEVKARNGQYEFLVEYLSSGLVRVSSVKTNL